MVRTHACNKSVNASSYFVDMAISVWCENSFEDRISGLLKFANYRGNARCSLEFALRRARLVIKHDSLLVQHSPSFSASSGQVLKVLYSFH